MVGLAVSEHTGVYVNSTQSQSAIAPVHTALEIVQYFWYGIEYFDDIAPIQMQILLPP